MLVNRRGILLGLGSILAAPAVVHAQNLMPIKALEPSLDDIQEFVHRQVSLGYAITREAIDRNLYSGLFPRQIEGIPLMYDLF